MTCDKVYEPRRAGDEYQGVVPVRSQDNLVLTSLEAKRQLAAWRQLPMRLLNGIECDFPWYTSSVLVLRPKAAELLRPYLEPFAEFLSLASTNGELFALNVVNVLDALDKNQSVYQTFDNSGQFGVIESYVFDKKKLADTLVFKIPQFLRGPIFVTEQFVDLIAANGLTGVGFKCLWDNDQPAFHVLGALSGTQTGRRQSIRQLLEEDRLSPNLNLDSDLWLLLTKRITGVDDLQSWPEAVQIYFASRLIEREVTNGGFAQAVQNIADWFPLAAAAYEALGNPGAAGLIRRALAAATIDAEGSTSAQGNLRLSPENRRDGVLSEFDEELDSVGWLSDRVRIAFVRANRDEFHEPGA